MASRRGGCAWPNEDGCGWWRVWLCSGQERRGARGGAAEGPGVSTLAGWLLWGDVGFCPVGLGGIGPLGRLALLLLMRPCSACGEFLCLRCVFLTLMRVVTWRDPFLSIL